MRRAKIYLSKSNSSDPQDIAKLSAVLEGLDIELTTFEGNGHTYEHTRMHGHDYILVMPPEFECDSVGRGQYEQIIYALKQKMDILYVNDVYMEDGFYHLSISEVRAIFPHNGKDWKYEYGRVVHNEAEIDIINYEGIRYNTARKISHDQRDFKCRTEALKALNSQNNKTEKRRIRLSIITLLKRKT